MKESADGVGADDEDVIKPHKKKRSVHECTDMVVAEDVVERSEFFRNENDWDKEGIFGTGNLGEMNNDVE
eukprot:14639838-Ditylum_brightwellii.AAC.1